MCTPFPLPPFLWEGGVGVETLTRFSKREGLRGSQFLEGVAGKEGVTFFRVGCSFYIKINHNLKYLTTKEVYEQKCFSVTTKNLNWEILSKNLVTFKRCDGVKDEKNLNITRVHRKI